MSADRHALIVGINRYPLFEDADLRGAVNDAERMAALLIDRFEVSPSKITMLQDLQATRASIVQAMDTMVETVDTGDVVIFFFSGHGSRMRDPRHEAGDGEDARMIESIVPSDSGHRDHPNRDVVDEEIDRWVQRLNVKTPFVTLILDSCHSGSATRDAFGERVRQVDPDERGAEMMFAAGQRPDVFELKRSLTTRSDASPTWVSGQRRAVVVAACRKEEKAFEVKRIGTDRILRYGALTDHLASVLAAFDGGTWRDVFERVAPAVSAEVTSQHPQFEGTLDQIVFGVEQIEPAAYLPVLSSDGTSVRLAGGSAHGVVIGSRWAIRDHGATHRENGLEIATVEVTAVDPVSSQAQILTSDARPDPMPGESLVLTGHRAFLLDTPATVTASPVALDVPSDRVADTEAMRSLLTASNLLSLVEIPEHARWLIRLLPPRASVDSKTPCPMLGPLETWTWAVVSSDGEIAVRTRAASAGGVDLVADLENRVRFTNLLALDHPRAERSLRQAVTVEALRRQPEQETFQSLQLDPELGAYPLHPGETCDLVMTNRSEATVWISLVEFGLDGKIALLLPRPGHSTFRLGENDGGGVGGFRLGAGKSISLRDYYAQDPAFAPAVKHGLSMSLPKGFPWSSETGRKSRFGLLRIKVFVTLEPASFEFLQQDAIRSTAHHPLIRAAVSATTGNRTESRRSTTGIRGETQGWAAPVVQLALFAESQGVE